MKRPLRIIVTDTSPLITLAVADELDLLLRPDLTLGIPDAVYFEATRVSQAHGASAIIDWIRDNPGQVQIIPTETGVDQLRRVAEGRKTRGMGETAAIEALTDFLARDPSAEALLLYEDGALARRRAFIDDRVGLISTGDFLRALEAAQKIQSSDRILDVAAGAGRNVDRQRSVTSDDSSRETLRAHLQQGKSVDKLQATRDLYAEYERADKPKGRDR